jgi:hypothetical protein
MIRHSPLRYQPSVEALEERCTPSALSSFLHDVPVLAPSSVTHARPALVALPSTPASPAAEQELPLFIPYGAGDDQPGAAMPSAPGRSNRLVFSIKVTGGGTAPLGLPVFPGGTAPYNATGTATILGRYTGHEGLFELLTFDPATGAGTFRGSFVFVATNGDRLACDYGADPANPGTFTLIPAGHGNVIAVFVAEFTPTPERCTGRFAQITGGRITMETITEPFSPVPNAQGYTAPFTYTWTGKGWLRVSKGFGRSAHATPPSTSAAPGAEHQRPFKETLTVVSVSNTGVVSYMGNATYFGHVTAVSYPDGSFVKTAANGDQVFGYITPATSTTGTLTFTGGTGRFEGATGTCSYVISTDPMSGATMVEVTGFISFGAGD